MAGPNVRAIVELNDMTYGNHYEILVDLLRRSQPPASPRSALPLPATALEGHGRTDATLTAEKPPTRCDATNFSPRSTSGEFGNFTLSATSVAPFRRGNAHGEGRGRGGDRMRRSWWHRLFGVGDDPPPHGSEEGCDIQGAQRHRQSTRGSAASSSTRSFAVAPAAEAPAAEAETSAARAKEGRRGRVHWTLTKGVASGAIVPSSLPETLLCQAFYNPAIIMIVEALLDPKGQGCGKPKDRGKDGARRAERDDKGSGNDNAGDTEDRGGEGGGGGGGGGGVGEASFLAQILPPKKFFKQAMHGGHRPNFQVRSSYL